MKLRVYKIAAFACLMAVGVKSNAQQSSSPSSSSSSNAPAVAQSPMAATAPGAAYAYTAPLTMHMDNLPSLNYAPMALAAMEVPGMFQDSAYRKKMQKLQEEMRDLQKQMSNLRTEEMKKNSEEIRKRYAEHSKVYADAFKNFDKTFSAKFQNFGQNMRFNFERSDADMDKKVQSGEYKLKTKSYAKSYNVDGNDKIQISNKFGKVTVNTWAKNEVKVDVEIKAYANEDADAQKLLDQVNIKDSKDNNEVIFTTTIGDEDHKNNFWGTWTSNGKTTIRKTVVNYTVYMPAKSSLTLTNSYGAVILPQLSGKVVLKNTYGNLTTKALTNPDNDINVRYGAADIESLNGSDLKVAYGSLNLQSADRLNAEVSYSPAKIGTISTSGTINVRFGDGLQIVNLGKGLKSLSVNSSYAPVKLSSLSNDNADFDVTVHNGGFTYDNGVNVTSKSPADDQHHWSSTQTYKGHVGKGNSDKVIVIKSNYSSVKFDQ